MIRQADLNHLLALIVGAIQARMAWEAGFYARQLARAVTMRRA